MRALLFPLILCAFFIAYGDDDSGPFLVRGDTASYSSEDADDFSSSSAQFSSSSEQRSSSSSERRISSSSMRSFSSMRSSSSVNSSSSSKTWMAENLNYAYLQPDSLEQFDSASVCYNDSLE